jgi:type IV pilus assembly protein PilQ
MKVLVVLRRTRGLISWKFISAIFCLSLIISCAANSGVSSPSTALNTEQLDSTQLNSTPGALTETAAVEPSDSRILSSLEKDSLGIELQESAKSDQIIINAKASAGDFTVNRISNPERIVIDISGASGSTLNKNFDASDTLFLNKVRVGSHPDKTRIVLDLPEGRNIQHAVDAKDNVLTVKLADDNVALNSQAPTTEVVATLVESDNVPAGDEKDNEAKASPDLASKALADNSKKAEALPPLTLKTLSLEQLGTEGNVLVAGIDNPGVYSLDQTAPSEYVLTLKDTKVDSSVGNLIAPPQSGLIRSVRAVQDGNDAVLRIFAQADTKLNARAGSDKIVVSAIGNKEDTDFRAQAETEKATKEEAKGAKDDTVSKPVEVKEVKDEGANNGEGFEKQLDELANSSYTGRLISLDLQDTDIDNALRIIAEVSNLNIIASDDVTGKVTLRLIDVPWDQALDVILKTNGLDKVREGNVIRIAPVEKLRQEREALKQLKVSQEELEPLQVKYIRISYAKASELKPLIETVVSERGVVTYDERSNQIIVKDIGGGIKNATELISRVDLRTPQVLLETQIVEASRSLLRDLGSELGLQYKQSPETGNATGQNFPNSIDISGSNTAGSNTASSFPAQSGSAISFLLGSADGSKDLDIRLSAYEREGRVRIISRPAVATTNNKQATIKSVEKIRVKTPQGGLSVATGSGASASGASAVATESFEVGIVLEVTPQASPDYYVLLDINAKSSTFGDREVEGVPSERERSATSTVLVSSGQTFAMGGIYKTTDNDLVQGVPFFKDIPFLGHFFRSMKTDNSDEELLFFITPRIVEGSFDDATMKFSS